MPSSPALVQTATRLTEASLAGEGHTAVEATAGADVAGIPAIGGTAKDHTLDDLLDVGPLVNGNLVFEAQGAPGVPVVTKDVAEAVVSGRTTRVTPGG